MNRCELKKKPGALILRRAHNHIFKTIHQGRVAAATTNTIMGLQLLIHVPHPERIALLHEHYAQERVSRIIFQVAAGSSSRRCAAFCRRRERCGCHIANATSLQSYPRGWTPGPTVLQHVSLCAAAAAADADTDWLFLHSDLWVHSFDRLPLHTHAFLLPLGGLEGWFPPAYEHPPGCAVPRTANRVRTYSNDAPRRQVHSRCVSLDHVATECTWHWMWGARTTCPAAAAASQIPECCFGWADLVYVPARLRPRFCALATGPFAAVPHEAAIPTITAALTAAHTVPAAAVERIACAGSCCRPVGWSEAMAHTTCAHRVDLANVPNSAITGHVLPHTMPPPMPKVATHHLPFNATAVDARHKCWQGRCLGARQRWHQVQAPPHPPPPSSPSPSPPPRARRRHQACQRLATPFWLGSARRVFGASCAGCRGVLYNPPGLRDVQIAGSLQRGGQAAQRGRRRLSPVTCERKRGMKPPPLPTNSDSTAASSPYASTMAASASHSALPRLLVWQPQFIDNFGETMLRLPEIGCLLAAHQERYNTSALGSAAWHLLVPTDFDTPSFVQSLLAPFGTLVPQKAAAGRRFGGGALCCWPWGPREWLSGYQLSEWSTDRAKRCGTSRRVLSHYGMWHVPTDVRRVVFARRNGPHRRLVNLGELTRRCTTALGLDCVSTDLGDEATPFAQRLRLVRSAHALVGLHGAAMTNAVFMRAQSLAVEVFACAFGRDHVVNRRGWGSANDFLAELVRYRQILAPEADPACARARSDEERRDCNVTLDWGELAGLLRGERGPTVSMRGCR